MRKILTVVIGLVAAAALAVGGYLVGVNQERPGRASLAELEQGLATALGVTPAEIREQLDRSAVQRCLDDGCNQIMIGPVPAPGTAMQYRLYDAGWVLHAHDEPECVSDNPAIFGWVCSYQRGDVTVSVQVESPETPDELYVWASTR